jgi:hypothetical protein
MKRIALLSAMTLASMGATNVVAQNYNTEWSGHKHVVINTTGTGAGIFKNVTGFPVLVRLDSTHSAIFTAAKADGADIRFTKANNTTRLPHHIETWDNVAKVAAIWVRVDTVYGNRNNQSVRMHWGNASAADESNGAAVFDTASGYRAAWHMGGTADVNDVTGTGLTALANGTPGTVAGISGSARSFNGTSSYFEVSGSAEGLHFPAFGKFSVSLWVNPTVVGTDATLFSKGDFAYSLKHYRETSYEFFDFQDAWVASISTTPPTVDTWVHLFAVNDETGPKLFVNGVLESADNGFEGSGARDDGLNVNIGREPQAAGGRRYFNGVIDEVRVHDTVRPVEWARLEYQTQRPGQTAVTLADNLPQLDTTSAPGAPTAVSVTAGAFSGMAVITWTAPASNGGAAITGYRAVAVSDSTRFCTSIGATTCTVTGLTPDSTYTFVVRAQNAAGMGVASEPSNSLKIPVSLRSSLTIQVAGNRNPFVFRLPEGLENTDNLSLSIIDTYGRTVWSRTVNPARDNVSRITWNGKTSTGAQAASGVYLVRVRYSERGQTVQHDLKGVTLSPR